MSWTWVPRREGSPIACCSGAPGRLPVWMWAAHNSIPRSSGDPRVTNLERINARNLKPGDLPRDAYDLIVIDVSFISLRNDSSAGLGAS